MRMALPRCKTTPSRPQLSRKYSAPARIRFRSVQPSRCMGTSSARPERWSSSSASAAWSGDGSLPPCIWTSQIRLAIWTTWRVPLARMFHSGSRSQIRLHLAGRTRCWPSRRCEQNSRDQHHFAVDVAGLCQLLGSGGLAQPEFPGDRNRELATSDRLSHTGGPHRIGLDHERLDANVLSLRGPGLSEHRAEHAAALELREQCSDDLAIHSVGNRIELGERANFDIRIERDDLRGPQRLSLLLLARAHAEDDVRPALQGDIYRRAPYPSERSCHQHGIAALWSDTLHQLCSGGNDQR